MGKVIKVVGISFAKPKCDLKPGDKVTVMADPDNKMDPRAVKIEHNGEMLGYVGKDDEFKDYLFSKGETELSVLLANKYKNGDDKLWKDVKEGELVQVSLDSGMYSVPSQHNPIDEIKMIIYRDEGRLIKCESPLELVSAQPYSVDFDPVEHRYYLNGEVCVSGSKFAHKFEKEFDYNMVNKYTGLSILEASAKKYGLSNTDDILKLWDIKREAAAAKGSALHYYLELFGKFRNKINEKDYDYILPQDNHQRKMVKDFYNKFGKLPTIHEATIWTRINSISVAGEIDMLEVVDTKKKIVNVCDFKTNNDVNKSTQLLEPFSKKGSKLIDAYWLQLSFYAAILMKVGYTVDKLKIYHEDQGEWVEYVSDVIDINNVINKEIL